MIDVTDLPMPGDLVTPYNLGPSRCLVIWSSWDDFPETDREFWPNIVGVLKEQETACVLRVYQPPDCNLIGVLICSQGDIIGWVNLRQLRTIK